jgi:CheY-like chemotaxis protein
MGTRRSKPPPKPAKKEPVRVLVVDDFEDNRLMYAEYLVHVGYSVETAVGVDAISKARKFCPAVVIMDLSLPRMDGWEATRIMKSDPATKGAHIVAVTGHGEPKYIERAREAGADDFLLKPCLPAVVAEKVAAFLESAPKSRTKNR